jgi:Kef-type K+ transport system membrane component KefB
VALVSGGALWTIFALILVVAVIGKLGGSAAAARLTGMRWREALSVGVLMNTRGLMELVILGVGLDIGVITPTLYAMMVLVALCTTVMASPLLVLLQRPVRARSAASSPAA